MPLRALLIASVLVLVMTAGEAVAADAGAVQRADRFLLSHHDATRAFVAQETAELARLRLELATASDAVRLRRSADAVRPALIAFTSIQNEAFRRFVKRDPIVRRLSASKRDALAVRMLDYLVPLQSEAATALLGALNGTPATGLLRPPTLSTSPLRTRKTPLSEHQHVQPYPSAEVVRGPGRGEPPARGRARAAQDDPGGVCVDVSIIIPGYYLTPFLTIDPKPLVEEVVAVCFDAADGEAVVITGATPGVGPEPTEGILPTGGDLVSMTLVDTLPPVNCNPDLGTACPRTELAAPRSVFNCSVFGNSNYYPLENRNNTVIRWATREVCPVAEITGGTLLRPRSSSLNLAAGRSYTCEAGDLACPKSEGRYEAEGQQRRKYSLDLCTKKDLVKPFGPWVKSPLIFGFATRKCSPFGGNSLTCVFTRLFSAP